MVMFRKSELTKKVNEFFQGVCVCLNKEKYRLKELMTTFESDFMQKEAV